MKFAAIADVHGNSAALEAVLADIACMGQCARFGMESGERSGAGRHAAVCSACDGVRKFWGLVLQQDADRAAHQLDDCCDRDESDADATPDLVVPGQLLVLQRAAAMLAHG